MTVEPNLNAISMLDNLQEYNEIPPLIPFHPPEPIERKETTTTTRAMPWFYLCLALASFLFVILLLLPLILRVPRKYQSKSLPVYL